MKKLFWLLIVSVFLASCENKEKPIDIPSTEVSTYKIDSDESELEWKLIEIQNDTEASHWGILKIQSGEFNIEDSNISSGQTIIDFGDSNFQKMLKSDELQKGVFTINKTESLSDGDFNSLISATIDLDGKTQPLEFRANKEVTDNEIHLFSEEFLVNGKEFNLDFNSINGNKIKDEVLFQLSLVSKKK